MTKPERKMESLAGSSPHPFAHHPVATTGAINPREAHGAHPGGSGELAPGLTGSVLPKSRFEPFRLGMPHMGPTGVDPGWLLRETCHIHWAVISERMGIVPSAFSDASGARVLASVVACTLKGDAMRFAEDDVVRLTLTEAPRARNGWRSQVALIKADGDHLRAEIVTAFARRAGSSNSGLTGADLDPAFAACRTGEAARRTNVIRRLGSADLTAAKQDRDPPHLTVEIDRMRHFNGVGLVYFSTLHDMIAQSERNAVPNLREAWAMHNRRVHFSGNLDAGDRLEITTRASAQALHPQAAVLVRSHARRASDGAVIAVAESLYAP